jgi:cytochrome c oxidase subunit 2
MKSPTVYLVTAFVIAFGVLVLIPVWFALGAVELEAGGGHHGSGEMIPVEEFRSRVMDQNKKYGLDDGSVRPPPGEVYILAMQFGYMPNTIRLKAGEHYTLVFLSADVLHGISLIQEKSLNSVIMPRMTTVVTIEPMRPGEALMLCNEYCGRGHHLMKGKIIVEGKPVEPHVHEEMGHPEHEEEDHEHETGS